MPAAWVRTSDCCSRRASAGDTCTEASAPKPVVMP